MEKEQEMRLTSLLSNVIIKEVSQKLAKQLLSKFSTQTQDSEATILSMINKFEQYKEGLDISKKDITKYNYNDLKGLILSKEMDKASSKAFTNLKKLWDSRKEQLPDDEAGQYRYQDSILKTLVTKFYDMYPYLKEGQRDIMKYDYLQLTKFINDNYAKLMNQLITKKMSQDPEFVNTGLNPDALLFYIQSYIRNRERVPKGTKPVALMTFRELEELVDGTLSQVDDDEMEQDFDDNSDIDRVYDENNLIIFAPKTKDQCIKLANGRPWCTSQTGSNNLYYNYRLNYERTLYYVIDQDKPFTDRYFATVILVDPYGRTAFADKTNTPPFGGSTNLDWDEISGYIPKLKGLKDVFKPVPLTQDERNLIETIKYVNVGDNPYESLGDEKTVEMWLEYKSPKLSDAQFANLSAELQKKYVALGFTLTGEQLKNAAEPVLNYYVNKKRDKLKTTPFEKLEAEDIELLSLPIMKKIKDENKQRYAESLVKVSENGKQIRVKYPNDNVSKYIRLYGLDEFIESIPDDITLFDIDNETTTNLNLKLPQSFKRFKNLDTFVGIKAFNEFPEVLKNMNELLFISLSESPSINEVPEWVADLPNLLAVTLYGNGSNIKIGPKVQQKWDEGDLNILFDQEN